MFNIINNLFSWKNNFIKIRNSVFFCSTDRYIKMTDDLHNLFQQLSINYNNNINGVNIEEDIEMYNQYVAKYGGHTGGWSDSDHNLYLKLRRKHNLHNAVRLLRQSLPDMSEKNIIDHDNWYDRYIQLRGRQQQAIKLWRLQKKTSRTFQQTNNSTENTKNEKKVTNIDENMKQKIHQWKENAQKQKEKELAQKQLADEKRKKEEYTKLLNQRYKNQIIKEQKKEERNFEKALQLAKDIEYRQQKEIRAKKANKMIKYFRKKDDVFLVKKQMEKTNSLLKIEAKEAKLKALAAKNRKNIRANRDPYRILQPTKEWEHKTRTTLSHMPPNMLQFKPFMSVIDIKHLGIPDWRRTIVSGNGEDNAKL